MSPKLLNILLILLPVSLYFGYIEPAYTGNTGFVWTPDSSIVALRSEKVQYENSIAQVELIQAELDKINKDYLGLDKTIKEKIEIMLPDNIDQFKLRNEVTSIANKANIAISSFKVNPVLVSENPKISGYKVSFSVQGDYSTIKILIESFEKNMRFFLIDNITINRRIKKDDTDKNFTDINETSLDSIISFNVYYLKP